MYTPNPVILKAIRTYDNKLYVKWNNKDCYWEIWRSMPWGDRLITPIVESIYIEGGDHKKFSPLDTRILNWLYLSDTRRKGVSKKWRWLSKKVYCENIQKRNERTKRLFNNIAKDHYNLINSEMLGIVGGAESHNEWVRPDKQGSSRDRIFYRSADNVNQYLGEA